MTIENIFVSTWCAVIACFFNQYFFQKKKEKRELKRYVKRMQLYKLYLPLRKELNKQFIFDEGYIGLDDAAIKQVINIIEQNIEFADDKLELYYWYFYNELNNRYFERSYHPDSNISEAFVDEDRGFFDFIEMEYKNLRSEVHMI